MFYKRRLTIIKSFSKENIIICVFSSECTFYILQTCICVCVKGIKTKSWNVIVLIGSSF